MSGYFRRMLTKGSVNMYETLIRIYFFKIKLSPIMRDNSGLLCGRLVNNLIRNIYILEGLKIDTNIILHVNYLTKLIT